MASEIQCSICGRTQTVDATSAEGPFVCDSCRGAQGRPKASLLHTIASAIDSAPPPAAALSQFGNYEIIEEISRGGVGIIYKARQRGLNRIVALKVLQGGSSASPEQIKRFLHEAQSAAKLQHPNIVPIHDFGSQDGQHYFTMDFIEGQSLAELLAKGPMQSREALEIVKQVADALHYAHAHGVVHRDIKPGNILIDKSGNVKVTDFGLAKELDRGEMHLTVTGQVMGTPRYMSPEQATGKTAQADARSDIFSLGVTLYELLTGQPAFEADNVVQMLQKIANEDPPAPHKRNRRVHRDISTICMKAIEKPPDRRYQTALAMTEDITRFLAGEPIEAKPASLLYLGLRRLRKHYKALLLYLAILYVTVHSIVIYLQGRPSFLQLKVDTTNAFVVLDHQPIGDEELKNNIPLKAGKHHVLVESEPFYDSQEFDLTTKPGETLTMNITLARRKGSVSIHTDPPDAGVTIIGPHDFQATFQGPTIEQELPTGPYTVLARKANYLVQQFDLDIVARQSHSFNITLQPIMLWAAATSGNILSVPVSGDFDGFGNGDAVIGDDDGNLYCFSGHNGTAVWVFRTGDAVHAPISKADMNGDGVPDVIVGSTDHKLYCLNGRNGQQLWSYQTGGPILGPALLKDVNTDRIPDVFVGSDDSYLYCLSGADGKLLWKFQTNGRIDSSLAWARNSKDDALLLGSLDKTLYSLNPRTGELLWSVNVGAPLHYPARIEDVQQNGGPLALLPTPKTAGDARTFTAVSLADHKVVSTSDTFPLWVDLNGDGLPAKMVVTDRGTECYAHDGTTLHWRCDYRIVTPYTADVNGDGVLDLIFNNGPTELLCLSGKDGSLIGRIVLDSPVGRGFALDDVDRDGVPDVIVGSGRKLYCFSWVGGRKRWMTRAETYFDSAMAAADGKVFTKNIGGELACYSPQQPKPLWKVQTDPQPSPYAAPAAGQGKIVDADANGRRLRAFSASDGSLAWQVLLPGETNAPIGAPTIAGDSVIVGDGDTGLYCFSLADGKERWQSSIPHVTTAAAVAGDSVFVADGTAAMHCLTLANGQSKWNFPVAFGFSGAPALADVNGDKILDAVALSHNGNVYAIDGATGEMLWRLQVTDARARTRNRVLLADLNGNGRPDGILALANGTLVSIDLKAGKTKWTYPLAAAVMAEPAIADLNGDGVPDVVVGTMGRRVRCISGKGDRELWSYEVGAQMRYSVPLILANGDAKNLPLLMIGTGPPENGLYCLSANGPRIKDRGWLGPWSELTSRR